MRSQQKQPKTTVQNPRSHAKSREESLYLDGQRSLTLNAIEGIAGDLRSVVGLQLELI
jgi:hypothetical protein